MVGADLAPFNVLEHEHLLGHVRADQLRDDQIRVVADDPADQLGVVSLLGEVELGLQVLLHLFGERRELEQLCRPGTPLEEVGGRAQQLEVDLRLLDYAGPAHLDDDLAPVPHQGFVDLCDRCRCERLRIDPDEDVVTQFATDDGLDLGERDRGTSSTSRQSSSMYTSGIRSGRDESSCPSLTYVVPSSSSARRNSRAPSAVAGRWPASPTSRNTRRSFLRRAVPSTSPARLSRSRLRPIGGFCPFRCKERDL